MVASGLAMRQVVSQSVGSLGALLVILALAWWAIVFFQVSTTTGLPMQQTASCLFFTSDRCSLAMSLCREGHIFGITRYSSGLLWVGVSIFSIALVAGAFAPRPSPRSVD